MSHRQEESTRKEQARRRYQEALDGNGDLPGEPPGQHAPRRDWQSLIEEQIARLDLDDLPNKGRPLDLSRNPYADPGQESANRLIKNAGFSLPWVEDGRKIDADLAAARAQLSRAWEQYMADRDRQICAGHQWIEGSWEAAQRDFRSQVERINREIRDYNLKVPAIALHKFSVRVTEEFARLGIAE